jgi:hypothetical protein
VIFPSLFWQRKLYARPARRTTIYAHSLIHTAQLYRRLFLSPAIYLTMPVCVYTVRQSS